MQDYIFATQAEFHRWLEQNHANHEGIWVRFDKQSHDHCVGPEQALDEALCFGWIDGQIQSIDERYYRKYFAKRRPTSIWSTKNKKSAERLIQDQKMMAPGLEAVNLAKEDGRWEKADTAPSDFSLEDFHRLIQQNEKAYVNFTKMSPSVQKTYAISYYSLKQSESRQRRLQVIFTRLENNLKPM